MTYINKKYLYYIIIIFSMWFLSANIISHLILFKYDSDNLHNMAGLPTNLNVSRYILFILFYWDFETYDVPKYHLKGDISTGF